MHQTPCGIRIELLDVMLRQLPPPVVVAAGIRTAASLFPVTVTGPGGNLSKPGCEWPISAIPAKAEVSFDEDLLHQLLDRGRLTSEQPHASRDLSLMPPDDPRVRLPISLQTACQIALLGWFTQPSTRLPAA